MSPYRRRPSRNTDAIALRTRTRTKFIPRKGGWYKDGATEGDLAEVHDLEHVDEPSTSGGHGVSGPGVELGPAGKKFVGFGLLLLGAWIAPKSADGAWLIPGVLMVLGFSGILKGIVESWGQGWHPFDVVRGGWGVFLRLVWFFRPRAYMVVWAVIIIGFMTIGTPHLRIVYGPAGCDYFGLNPNTVQWACQMKSLQSG
jgi:hypothetical protein